MGRNARRLRHLLDMKGAGGDSVSQSMRGKDDKLTVALVCLLDVSLQNVESQLTSRLVHEHIILIHETERAFNLQAEQEAVKL
jgi:hypothetical protein